MGKRKDNITDVNVCDIVGLNLIQYENKIPKFKNENEMNPLEFLEILDRYLNLKNIKDDKKLAIVDMALERKAHLWWMLQSNIKTYEEFVKSFKEHFYSVATQVSVRNKWANKKFTKNEGNLHDFYFKQLRESSFIRPILSEYEKNFTIVQQLPLWVREAIALIDLTKSDNIGQTLTHLDLIYADRMKINNKKQFSNERNNHGSGAVQNIYNNNNDSNKINQGFRYVNTNKINTRQDFHQNKYYNRRHNNYVNPYYRNNKTSNQNNYQVKVSQDQDNFQNNINVSKCNNQVVQPYQGYVIPDTRFPPPNHTQTSQSPQSTSHLN